MEMQRAVMAILVVPGAASIYSSRSFIPCKGRDGMRIRVLAHGWLVEYLNKICDFASGISNEFVQANSVARIAVDTLPGGCLNAINRSFLM